jgi:hypothetical protein
MPIPIHLVSCKVSPGFRLFGSRALGHLGFWAHLGSWALVEGVWGALPALEHSKVCTLCYFGHLQFLPASTRSVPPCIHFALLLVVVLGRPLIKLGTRVSIIRIFIRIFFSENYSLFEYFLTEYSNNNFLLNKP